MCGYIFLKISIFKDFYSCGLSILYVLSRFDLELDLESYYNSPVVCLRFVPQKRLFGPLGVKWAYFIYFYFDPGPGRPVSNCPLAHK